MQQSFSDSQLAVVDGLRHYADNTKTRITVKDEQNFISNKKMLDLEHEFNNLIQQRNKLVDIEEEPSANFINQARKQSNREAVQKPFGLSNWPEIDSPDCSAPPKHKHEFIGQSSAALLPEAQRLSANFGGGYPEETRFCAQNRSQGEGEEDDEEWSPNVPDIASNRSKQENIEVFNERESNGQQMVVADRFARTPALGQLQKTQLLQNINTISDQLKILYDINISLTDLSDYHLDDLRETERELKRLFEKAQRSQLIFDVATAGFTLGEHFLDGKTQIFGVKPDARGIGNIYLQQMKCYNSEISDEINNFYQEYNITPGMQKILSFGIACLKRMLVNGSSNQKHRQNMERTFSQL